MADSLHFNIESLSVQAVKIQEIAAELKDATNTLSVKLDMLRTDWDTETGQKFLAKYDTSWMAQVDSYCVLLEELSEAMKFAVEKYGPLEEEYNKLNLE